jgi:hypothetical protein
MTVKDTPPPSGVGAARTQGQPAASGVAAGQYQPVTADLGQPLSPGGMRGIGLLAFMAAQIALKLETLDLAKDYFNTNKRDFDFFRVTHQPGMQQSAAEVMSSTLNPMVQPDEYASSPAGLSTSKAIDRKWFETRRRTGRYNVGAHRRMDYDFAVLRAAAVASGWNMGRRYELAWADAHNERAYNRKLAMANVGIQAGNTMRQGLATAVNNVQSAYTGLGDTVFSVANGYYQKAGYEDARKQVKQRYGQATQSSDYATE